MRKLAWMALCAGLALATVAVAAEKEPAQPSQSIALADLPVAARATVEKFTDGGTIEKIEKQIEDGQVVYDVEATVKDKHREVTVAGDGTVLSTEEHVALNSLPKAVRDAAEKYFGSANELRASKEIEAGKISFEVEGKKGDSKMTLKLDKDGKIIEEEKE